VPSTPIPLSTVSLSAPTTQILQAASVGFLGLIVGVLPLFLSGLAIQALVEPWPDLGINVALPVGVAGFLAAGICAGFAAAWRLRPLGKLGRRAAGQLSVLFAEAIVVLVILVRNPVEPTDGCSYFCFNLDQVLGMLALIGWPVAAVGALIGAALERRRDEAVVRPAATPALSQRLP
jgi:hypothetical protein